MADARAPRFKLCGITSLDDARLGVESGAWALGLIFYGRSPRACALPEAERIARELRRRVEIAGVFVNAPLEEVVATADGVRLTMVQLHGDEGPSFCSEIGRASCRERV